MAAKTPPSKRAAPLAENDIEAPEREDGVDTLPDEAAIAALMRSVEDFAQSGRLARVRACLNRLSRRPPQVLLMEGGTREERLAAVHYWMLALNCPRPPFSADMDEGGGKGEHALPPGWQALPVAVQLVTHLHRDCFFMDGSAGSIKIEPLREVVKPALGEPPREARYRMVIFHEAQALTPPSANIMLKSLEEPLAATSFVLLAPQRESLLPTLVSRSMILTLPWPPSLPPESVPEEYPLLEGDLHHALREDSPEQGGRAEQEASLEADVCTFIRHGTGMFQRTSQRSSIKSGLKGFDAEAGQALVTLCRRALVAAHTVRPLPGDSLAGFFATLPPARQRIVDEVLAEGQDSLNAGITPGVVADWVMTRLYLVFPRK